MTATTSTTPHHSAPFTLRSAAGLPPSPPPLAASALVIIDAQAEYGPEGGLPLDGLDVALERTAALLDRARSMGRPIVHVLHHGPAGGLFDPDRGGRVLAEARPVDGEAIVHKRLPNAFANTEFAARLDQADRPPLVLAGFMTHMCVSSTARAALDLGYETTVVSDATATRSLPGVGCGAGSEALVAAADVHRSALAAFPDRFSFVVAAAALLA